MKKRNKKGRNPTHDSTVSPQCALLPFGRQQKHSTILMIKLFSVFCKLIRINKSDLEWFRYEKDRFSPYGSSCPMCGTRGGLRPHGTYTRYLVSAGKDGVQEQRVTLSRYQCVSCGHTHAAHPSCLIPYSSYSLSFVLRVLRLYFLRLHPVSRLCEHFGISISTLYRFRDLFLAQKKLWLGLLQDLEEGALSFLEGLNGQTLFSYLSAFRSSFLERLPGRVPELPFPILLPPGLSTQDGNGKSPGALLSF